ncbi:MAG: DUF6268 family outer membrane beta-barrel protein [Flammeovirgaceae bacterium]
MKQQTIGIVLFLLVLTSNLLGQSYFDLVSVRYQQTPKTAYKEQNGDVQINELKASLVLPIPLKNKNTLLVGLAYGRLDLDQNFEQSVTDHPISHQFQSIALQLGMVKNLNEKTKLTLMLIPKLASDFEELSSKDFQLGGLALFTRVKNERFKWKYGFYYNREYFASFFVPLLGFDWKFNDKWRFWALLPQGATLERTLNQRFRTGLQYETPLVSYRLSEHLISYPNGYLHQMYYGKLDVFLESYLTKQVVLQARVGHTLLRKYRVFAENDTQGLNIWGIGFQERSEMQPTAYNAIKDGVVVELGLRFRYDLESTSQKDTTK